MLLTDSKKFPDTAPILWLVTSLKFVELSLFPSSPRFSFQLGFNLKKNEKEKSVCVCSRSSDSVFPIQPLRPGEPV